MDAAERVSRDRIKESDAGGAQPVPSNLPPERRRFWRWIIGIPLVMLMIIGLAVAFIDEPLRAYAERQLNRRVDGYTFRIGKLDFHPLGLSLDLEDVTMIQTDHPDPPVAHLTKWHASVHWRELLSGHLVSDQAMDHPVLHITRPQAAKEAKDEVSIEKRGWQDAVLTIYPLKINEFTINDGDVTYRENSNSKPLHVSHLNFRATNIRNVRSKPDEYPSHLHLDAVIFDKGRVTLDGRADFLSEPYLGMNTDISMQDVELVNVLPLTAQRQVHLTQGVMSTTGHVEYSPRTQVVRLKDLSLRDVKLDFVHAIESAPKEKDTGRKVARTADTVANHPKLLLRIDKGMIDNSEFGFVNTATNPEYRVFLTGTDIYLENWSNQLSEGTAIVKLRGMFMGTGATQLNGAFRPETKSPDFDLDLRVWKTQVKSMNNLLRAHGGMDVVSGVFSVFTEMTVKNGSIDGYLKPLFKDVEAYDPAQDNDKGLLKKIYEKLINAASTVLKNTPRGEVATKADLSGPVENPKASTWEMVVTLIQNAFFEAVLPGFEKQGRKS
ncbi:MAG TPA: DUF748 domain-containing protein [Nitrospiraceae bacterium]|nr:DUF748 domain-containing protein [Nitrospiraceae bacterium]